MDEDYFSGIKLVLEQASTGKPNFKNYQKDIFGPYGTILPTDMTDSDSFALPKKLESGETALKSSGTAWTIVWGIIFAFAVLIILAVSLPKLFRGSY